MVAKYRQLVEDLINFTTMLRWIGWLPSDHTLERLTQCLKVPEVLDNDVEKTIVGAYVIRKFKAPILLVCATDWLSCRGVASWGYCVTIFAFTFIVYHGLGRLLVMSLNHVFYSTLSF